MWSPSLLYQYCTVSQHGVHDRTTQITRTHTTITITSISPSLSHPHHHHIHHHHYHRTLSYAFHAHSIPSNTYRHTHTHHTITSCTHTITSCTHHHIYACTHHHHHIHAHVVQQHISYSSEYTSLNNYFYAIWLFHRSCDMHKCCRSNLPVHSWHLSATKWMLHNKYLLYKHCP